MQSQPAAIPPGPKGHLLTGQLGELRRDILGLFERCARDYGDFVPLRFGPKKAFLVNRPDLIEAVMTADSGSIRKPFVQEVLRPLIGDALVIAEGEAWRRQRRMVQPAFHRERIAGYGAIMVDLARRAAASFQDGEVRTISDDMQRITLAIASKCLFDMDIDGEGRAFGDASDAIMEFFEARMASLLPLPLWVPTPLNRKIRRAMQAADRLVHELISRRRRGGEVRSDVLSTLLAAEYEGGGHMADQQIRDEVFSLLIAGQEASAVSLSWTFHLLAQHPDVDARLQEELRTVLGGRSPEPGDLPRLRYTEQIIKEVMRLYPPFYFYGRDVIASCDIGEYRVHAGATLFVSPWLIQRDKRYFEQPLAFDPGRWTDDAAKELPKYAYFPFGGGSRACVASAFAMMESVLVLATLAQSFRFEPVPGHTVTPWPVVTIRPKQGIKLKIARR